jgi:hypothetical protein
MAAGMGMAASGGLTQRRVDVPGKAICGGAKATPVMGVAGVDAGARAAASLNERGWATARDFTSGLTLARRGGVAATVRAGAGVRAAGAISRRATRIGAGLVFGAAAHHAQLISAACTSALMASTTTIRTRGRGVATPAVG